MKSLLYMSPHAHVAIFFTFMGLFIVGALWYIARAGRNENEEKEKERN